MAEESGKKMDGRTGHARPVLAALLTLGAIVTVACSVPGGPTTEPSSAPPVLNEPAPIAESFAKYDSLRVDLVAALEKNLPGITWTVDNPATVAATSDGRCIFHPASMKSSADIVEASKNFATVFTAADPILKQHEFPAFNGIDPVPGGWVVTRSTDGAGATVIIESKSPAYLRMNVPVDSTTCDPSELPAG